MMREARKMWSISGHGDMHEARILGIWFYCRVTRQEWAPLMHEFERERGMRIGHRRFGMTETVKRFYDGKQPSTVRGAF